MPSTIETLLITTLYLANLTTGDKKLLIKNDNFSYFAPDNDYNIRFAGNTTPGGGEMVYRRLDNGSGSQYMKLKLGLGDESNTGIIGFSRNNSVMYMVDSRGRDTSALAATKMTTGKTKVLAETPLADINRVMMHPTQSTPEVAYYIYDRKHFILLNKSLQKDFDFLKTVDSGELDVYWRTLNDKKWFVLYARDNGSYRHYEYDKGAKKVKYLFSLRLEGWRT